MGEEDISQIVLDTNLILRESTGIVSK
jgi:hypothetical protein